MRLFHFSDDPAIALFQPRPVATPSLRGPGLEWLNGPLVWGIDDAHQPLYLFPRECPRILVWAHAGTTAQDRDRWFGGRSYRMIAHIEWAWFDRLQRGVLYRYELEPAGFEPLHDAGMWVSRRTATPLARTVIEDLPAALSTQGVELRVMQTLAPLRGVWGTSLHASGIRLRNARDWTPPAG